MTLNRFQSGFFPPVLSAVTAPWWPNISPVQSTANRSLFSIHHWSSKKQLTRQMITTCSWTDCTRDQKNPIFFVSRLYLSGRTPAVAADGVTFTSLTCRSIRLMHINEVRQQQQQPGSIQEHWFTVCIRYYRVESGGRCEVSLFVLRPHNPLFVCIISWCSCWKIYNWMLCKCPWMGFEAWFELQWKTI